MTYDVIVIGSGIGGLTTAGLLARAAGKRVLVLERHTEPGGLTHTFRRDGASWDVGVHYIGHLGPGSQGRAYFDYLSGGELEWNRMPDAYDRFVYPGVDLCVSSDPDRYERDLVAAFPQEARAIHRYFQDVQRVTRWVTLGFVQGMVPRPAASLLRAAQRLGGDDEPPGRRRRIWMPTSAPPSSRPSWPASGGTTASRRPNQPLPCTR